MKKIIILLMPFFLAGCLQNVKFTPKMEKIDTFEEVRPPFYKNKFLEPPYIAIYKYGNKTLIYLAAAHMNDKTLNMVDYIFDSFKPQAALLENFRGDKTPFKKCYKMESHYTAAKAEEKAIPIVRSDANQKDVWKKLVKEGNYTYYDLQGYLIIRSIVANADNPCKKKSAREDIATFEKRLHKDEFGKLFTPQELNVWTQKNFGESYDSINFQNYSCARLIFPIKNGYITNSISIDEDLHARDPFIIKNIAAALNKYDTVLAVFGEGHYQTQQNALKDMLGEPKEYITETDKPFVMHVCEGISQPKEVVLVPDF